MATGFMWIDNTKTLAGNKIHLNFLHTGYRENIFDYLQCSYGKEWGNQIRHSAVWFLTWFLVWFQSVLQLYFPAEYLLVCIHDTNYLSKESPWHDLLNGCGVVNLHHSLEKGIEKCPRDWYESNYCNILTKLEYLYQR